MSLLVRNVIRSNGFLRLKPYQGLHLHHREPQKQHFSTETEAGQSPPPPTPPLQDSSVDPFLQSPNIASTYAKLLGIGKHTLKTDIINMLESCDLSPQDIKVEYSRSFAPLSMIVKFPAQSGFDNALRVIRGKRLYRLDKVDRSMWEIPSYEGKTVLFQGLPRNALPEDVERFLSGCEFNSGNLQMFARQAMPDPVRMALVQFASKTEAMNAVLQKNRSFCLNNQILMQVLQ